MLEFFREDSIAVWTLATPPVNAIDDAWIDAFHGALDDISAKGKVSALLIRSDQDVFCAGFDLKIVRACSSGEQRPEDMVAAVGRLQELYTRIERLDQVTIAEMGGAAMGGGLALACDMRVAAQETTLGLPEVSIGLLPGAGGTQRLSQLCGPGVARRLILGAEVIDGTTAEALGLVHWAVPKADLVAWTWDLTARIASLPRAALQKSKQCLLDAADFEKDGFESELAGTRSLLDDPETRDRVTGFLNRTSKRPAPATDTRSTKELGREAR